MATFIPWATHAARRAPLLRATVLACLGLLLGAARAQTTLLADAPLFSTVNAPGNLSMVLSVEFPTAVSVAHANRTYSSGTTYLGYFDEAKCYAYQSSTTDLTSASPPAATPASYFVPSTIAAAHRCSGLWSGNFLNWASMQTIDTFRWVLTGGYRVIDTSTLTVIEKAWASGQGGANNFPDSTLSAAEVANATPFGSLNSGPLNMRIQGLGNQMRFVVTPTQGYSSSLYSVSYYNNTAVSGTAVASANVSDPNAALTTGVDVSPIPGIVNADYYSVHYKISVTPTVTGTYYFRTTSDDGARLYVNGNRIINDWSPDAGHSAQDSTDPGNYKLTAGTTYTIDVDYLELAGFASLDVKWKTPGASDYTPILGTNSLNAAAVPANFSSPATATLNTVYSVFMRAKTCDTTVGAETNCVAYAAGSKPEGLLQKYSNKLRYSAFGYLNDASSTRDAGVLRAAQKFIGPDAPLYGSPPAINLAGEWDRTTGVLTNDPDCGLPSTDPARPPDKSCPTSGPSSSGVINYVNKFGELLRNGYKTNDPVSELYYAAIRYFKNLGNVPEWSNMSTAQRQVMMDGFPALTSWKDPVIGSCQRNFILGIGDTHTWLDKDVPGNTNTAGEPLPTPALADPSLPNAVTATNKIGAMESGGTVTALGTKSPFGSCCSNNSTLMAGLAYDAHTSGVRTYKDGTVQTLDTYWLDVQEGGHYEPNNQYYLTTKYGGFKVPDGFKPYDAGTTTLADSTWWSGIPSDVLTYGGTTNKRPKNYYSAGAPDKMQAGLIAAFKDAAATSSLSYSTSFSLPVPQVSSTGSASYSASYIPATWSGDLTGATLTFDTDGTPILSDPVWHFDNKLRAQAAGTGWATQRRIVTWNGTIGVPFEQRTSGATSGITDAQLKSLDTALVSGGDALTDLQYLRGDVTHEIPVSGAADDTHYYRNRVGPLGDIVNSKPVVVAAPAFPYGDTSNPGYGKFKSSEPVVSRKPVAYVGANDGMLHAVDARLDAGGGSEIFAYVPSPLFLGPNGTPSVDGLASLSDPSFVHHYMVDGPVSYFDIDFSRTGGSPASPEWHTVLIGAMGKGGKGYFAIDVTDPNAMTSEAEVAKKVLWEYTNTASLGYTYGKPVVVKTRAYGWVVALPSGYDNGDGYSHIIFLNPATGALLDDVKMPTTTRGGLAQLNAYILDPTDGTANAFYAGDLDGNIWRLDVTQTTTAPFPRPTNPLAKLTSAAPSTSKAALGPAQPVTVVPFVQIDPETRRRFVLVGTGRLLDTSDITSTQVQSFYAIWDGDNVAFSAAPEDGKTKFPIDRSTLLPRTDAQTIDHSTSIPLSGYNGWYIDLAITDEKTGAIVSKPRLVNQMTTSYGEVAFAATVPIGDMCSPGGSSVYYAFAYGSAQSVLLDPAGPVGTTKANKPVDNSTTDIGFTSNNGVLSLIYGTPKSPKLNTLPISGLSIDVPRRVNWREVPLVD